MWGEKKPVYTVFRGWQPASITNMICIWRAMISKAFFKKLILSMYILTAMSTQ